MNSQAVETHQHHIGNAKGSKAGLFDMFYNDIAIDLGTANTLIATKRNGIVYSEPSVIAFNPKGSPVSIGREAWQMHEKTHSEIRTVRPLKDGVIADFEAAEHMLRGMIKCAKKKWYSSTRQMVICVPSGITDVEKRAVRDSAENAGAREVYMVEEPMAAAIGVGLSVHEPKGHMVVDIGGGTTEIAVIALAGVIHAQSVRLAGDKLTEDIMHYFRRTQNLLIGYKTAEKIKCEIGSAAPLDEELEMDIKGRDLVRGIPKTLRVSSVEVRSAISQTLNLIVESILGSLEETPPELAGDILDHGIMLAGGGALLKNLDRRIAERIDLPVHIAEDPMTAVVRGTGAVLDDLEYYKAVLV
jgi:rod shape-determining protein MreB and related proteins